MRACPCCNSLDTRDVHDPSSTSSEVKYMYSICNSCGVLFDHNVIFKNKESEENNV